MELSRTRRGDEAFLKDEHGYPAGDAMMSTPAAAGSP